MSCEMDNGALFRITGSCSFGPHVNRYRISCKNGGAETVRGSNNQVHVIYNAWTTYNFIQCLLGKQKPYFDVYRATAMSAATIFGWYSVPDNSCQMDIPDFRIVTQRRMYENDNRTSYLSEGKPATLPCTGRDWNPEYL